MKILKKSLPIIAVILWFIIGVIFYAIAFNDLFSMFWFIPCLLLIGALGLALAIFFTIVIWKKQKWILAIAYLSLWLIVGYLLWSDGNILGAKLRFLTKWHYYNKVVNACYAPGLIPDELKGGDYEVDPGPPKRIAFSWGGIIDNWVGVVYDPTGEILIINGVKSDWSNWNDAKFSKMKSLFGGTMYRADHLFSHYYLCWFT